MTIFWRNFEPLPRSEPSKQIDWVLHGPGSEPSKQIDQDLFWGIFDGELLEKRWPSPWTPHTNRGQVRAQGLDTLQRRSTTLDADKDLLQGAMSQMA